MEISKLIDEKKKEFTVVSNHLRRIILDWRFNDPVLKMYNDLFDSTVIFDMQLSEERKVSIKKRVEGNMPPGYKDKGKDVNAYGDAIIWESIIEIGRIHESNILFVTNEKKNDWLESGDEQARIPRSELVMEFFSQCNKRTFDLVNFQDFLTLFQASQDIVKEIGELVEHKGPLSKLTNEDLIDRAMTIVGDLREGLEIYNKESIFRIRSWSNEDFFNSHSMMLTELIGKYETVYKVAAVLLREEFMTRLGIKDDRHWRFLYEHPVNTHTLRDIADDLERMCQLLDHAAI